MDNRANSKISIWFWQRMLSPHMTALADSLACSGYDVTFIANEKISQERSAQGWIAPRLNNVKIQFAETVSEVERLIKSAPANSIHICQGFRGDGLVHDARKILYKYRLRHWVVMEGVDDQGLLGVLKRIIYRVIFLLNKKKIDGILAIGEKTRDWIANRGFPNEKIFHFAYFLQDHVSDENNFQKILKEKSHAFTIIFVGQLIERKRVDLLISAISALNKKEIELWVIGGGRLEPYLIELGKVKLSNKVRWFGVRSMSDIRSFMMMADCLVLPSRHDGWGAVVSESLMVGTPVICSDACGASTAVRESNAGVVFPSGNLAALNAALFRQYECGHWCSAKRIQLAEWARCLGANSGAEYLVKILTYQTENGNRPQAPWFGLCNP